MFVSPITGIDDVGATEGTEVMRGTGCGVPDDEGICVHGFEIFYGIPKALPFGDRTGLFAEIDDVGAQPLCRQFE